MRQLPSMHAVLNVVEDMLLESCQKESDRADLLRKLYRPVEGETPAGFTRAEQQASLDGFMGAFEDA